MSLDILVGSIVKTVLDIDSGTTTIGPDDSIFWRYSATHQKFIFGGSIDYPLPPSDIYPQPLWLWENVENIPLNIQSFVSTGLKFKVIEGTTPSIANSETWIPTGVAIDKILSWECVIIYPNYLVDSPFYHSPTNYQFDVHIHVLNGVPCVRFITTSNSSAILGKNFKALITYTD